MPMPKPHVIFYSRPNCHLCDLAKESIEEANCADKYTLATVNIEDDAELLGRYGLAIPVVTINGREEFRYEVNRQRFRELILKYGNTI